MKNKSLWVLFIIFSVTFLGFKYFQSNLDYIYGLKANYYHKTNQLSKALYYYEKAFSSGLSNSKAREIYINSIINSPLTIESQKKILNFIEYNVEDSSKLKAQIFLNDIKREINNKYDGNFINNTLFNHKVIRWDSLPITYSFIDKTNVPNYYITEINDAFNEWERVTNQQINFEEVEEKPNIIIKFEENNFANDKTQKFVAAYTTPFLNFDELENMEILFYLKNPYNELFTKNQIYNTALHEIAHAIGFMGHSNNKKDVLYFSKDAHIDNKNIKQNLSESDVNTIKLLYKIKPDISNVKNPQGEYLPAFVLGSKNEVQNGKINEAKLYIKKAPYLPAGYIDLAEVYVNLKDYSKALIYLEKALSLADTNELKGLIYFNLSVINYYNNNLDDALNYLDKSRNIKDSEEKIYLLAEIYTKKCKINDAIEIYSDLLKNNPNNIEYAIALINIHVMNRNYLSARKVLKMFLKNNPNEKNNPRFNSYGILNLGL